MANLNEKKKFHFIYKTTNLKNGKYYIGMHSTSNLKDGYLGSGTYLRYSIRKHGIECFTCEILEFLPDRLLLAAKEREMVNEELIHDEKCMNLKPGGCGGFNNKEHMMKCSAAGNVAFIKKLKENPEFREKCQKASSITFIRSQKEGKIKQWPESFSWNGRHHTPETKQKMKMVHIGKHVGELNSQYGSHWITDGTENKKIKKEEIIPNGWQIGRILSKRS